MDLESFITTVFCTIDDFSANPAPSCASAAPRPRWLTAKF